MVAANIPWKKLENPDFNAFLNKYINMKIPYESTLKKHYLHSTYLSTGEKIREDIGESCIWANVNETTDRCGRYVANVVVVGKLDSTGPGKPHLVVSKILEATNSSTIAIVVRDALHEPHQIRSHRSSDGNPKMRHTHHQATGFHTPVAEALRAEPQQTTYTKLTVTPGTTRLVIQDNHKPVFTNCSTYQPTVKEEQDPGTYVFTVTALDKDPPESGGTVTYTFVEKRDEKTPKFNIDPNTGVITTRIRFDRDEPIREKEEYLVVRATDNGRPQLDDVCNIKVVIEDINDNSPVFDKVTYLESVPQDLAVGREVMRISATDIDDGNNSRVAYSLERNPGYFRIDSNNGVIFLDKPIDMDPGHKFTMTGRAEDSGTPPRMTEIELEVLVVESHKKAPTFVDGGATWDITLPENYSNYTAALPNGVFKAVSNVPEDSEVIFTLVSGATEQTNKLGTFILETKGDTAFIKLGSALDYETINEYTLTLGVRNKHKLAAETSINVFVTDVNDHIPSFNFKEVPEGIVLENEPPGTPVMQVRAIDIDGTSANNIVSYKLDENSKHRDLFQIDKDTGNITTLREFDREENNRYQIKVIAYDNSPSALKNNGEPNTAELSFWINIGDKNDNPPVFTQKIYVAEEIPENANTNALVTEVKALDKDTASPVTYDILEGNVGDAFYIENTTGKIRVKNQLDYESITAYTLTVRAFDGKYNDTAKVEIKIANVNDNPPVFLKFNNNITIQEEMIVEGCIANLEAYDPDIQDRSAPQHIQFDVVKEDQKTLLSIDEQGCLRLIKPLDRDPPNGSPVWQVLIAANDEDGGPSSLQSTAELIIILEDINDNAPILDMVQPVVWRENQPPGKITTLKAKDYDSEANGAPFKFRIDDSAGPEITNNFAIRNDEELEALVTFDREERKVYLLPIAITDSGIPPLTGTSTLTIVIGDENDNPMKPGQSNIFVYNYKGEAPDTEVGRVYVEDPDDWDLPDKYFVWKNGNHPNFDLNANTGMITMLSHIPEGTYALEFTVTEEAPLIPRHSVDAIVNITIKVIPEEAVDKSGSIRFAGITAPEFVAPGPNGSPSKQELLRWRLASLLNVSVENVDVFTVLHSPHNTNGTQLDVRYSAHGSPYRQPEKLNNLLAAHQDEIEQELGLTILMVNIDECLMEKVFCETESCTNFLNKSNVPYSVYTNTSSFVGVRAVVDPLCNCKVKERPICLNGGTPVGPFNCECIDGFEGPYCELISIGFHGKGWALYPPLSACEEARVSLEVTPYTEDGLILYVGPLRYNPALHVQDFMSLELRSGFPRLLMDYGTGTVFVENKQIKLSDNKPHHIDVIWSKTSIELKVDNCQMSSCLALTTPQGPNEFLNVNGPVQLGGTTIDLLSLSKLMNWTHVPTSEGFSGCIRNLTFNEKTYNLGYPSDSKNVNPGCTMEMAKAVSFGIDSNFLVAILVCVAILLILLLAVVVHRRKTDDMFKDTDDIRENIINYEDEGGGEGDMTGYDLNVLRLMYDQDGLPIVDKPPLKENYHTRSAPEEVPDICGFLDAKKKVCDNDPETYPFDDVRHYAYEGDGNSTGSLSSLASGTDENDLNFDDLSNFGPRFRKLADMYGEDPSDEEEEENFHNAASESWC